MILHYFLYYTYLCFLIEYCGPLQNFFVTEVASSKDYAHLNLKYAANVICNVGLIDECTVNTPMD